MTFRPTIIGFGAVLDNLSAFVDTNTARRDRRRAAVLYLLVWIFLAGGIIDRYARNRTTTPQAFFQACGGFFGRLVRLAIISSVLYALLFGTLLPSLLATYDRLTHGLNVERTAFFLRLALYLVFGSLLAVSNLLFDYAKIRLVMEDRRSAVGALSAGGRFIRRHWRGCIGLYAVDVLLLALVLTVYALIAPGAGSAGPSMWAGFAVSQCYILARLWVKLVFWGFGGRLVPDQFADVGYSAVTPLSWPESAIVAEAIGRNEAGG